MEPIDHETLEALAHLDQLAIEHGFGYGVGRVCTHPDLTWRGGPWRCSVTQGRLAYPSLDCTFVVQDISRTAVIAQVIAFVTVAAQEYRPEGEEGADDE